MADSREGEGCFVGSNGWGLERGYVGGERRKDRGGGVGGRRKKERDK